MMKQRSTNEVLSLPNVIIVRMTVRVVGGLCQGRYGDLTGGTR